MSYKEKTKTKAKENGDISLSIALSEFALITVDLNPVEAQQLIIELENLLRKKNEKI